MTTNVWLVRSAEMDKQRFLNVYNLLHSIKGYFIFKTIEKDNEADEGNKKSSELPKNEFHFEPWQYFFEIANDFRKDYNIGDVEFVVVLSDIDNTENWFSGADYGGKRNVFVHASGWETFTKESDVRYPISYHVAITLLHHIWFKNERILLDKVHKDSQTPIGCINDFCGVKSKVNLKMRTGDICDECLEDLIKEKVDNNLIKHVLDIIGQISSFMRFSNKWKIEVRLPILSIEGQNKEFVFKDFGNLKLNKKLSSPLHRALYSLILDNHLDGTSLNMDDFTEHEKVQEDFINYYFEVSGYKYSESRFYPEEYQKARETITKKCKRKNSISELISDLKKAFSQALGEELAKKYYIMQAKKGSREKKMPYIIGDSISDLELSHIINC